MKPAISIIVPVYNIEAYLEKCLDSILAQTFSNFEVIVVNDGSTDGSGKICDTYAGKDKRIRVIHQKYGGVSIARNAGLRAADGDYIGFVDGDDYIDEQMYETLYQLCQETESDIAVCKLGRVIDGKLINHDKGGLYTKEFYNQEAISELFKGILYRFSLCNKLFYRSCFKSIYFPEGRIHEDLSTTYRLFANANKTIFVNYIGYMYLKRDRSILTSTYYKKRLEAFVGWDEILVYMDKNYPMLANDFVTSFAYHCFDNIYYILNQINEKKVKIEYLGVIQKYVRKYYRQVMKNSELSLKSKILITIININPRLFVFTYHFKWK